MSKTDLLIAEDDPILRNLYVKRFSGGNYTIRAVEDGEEAVKELKKHLPDLLILDIHMPRMDGFQVLELYPPEDRQFPVIVLTNFADEKSKSRGKDLGADDYFIKKDMSIKSLEEMVERILKEWKGGKK